MEGGYHAHTAGVVSRSKRHTHRQDFHILLILTHLWKWINFKINFKL